MSVKPLSVALLALAALSATAHASPAAILPPPPAQGSPQNTADRQIFAQTRALKDTPRWAMAASDSRLAPSALLEDFSCAAGFALNAEKTPALTALIEKLEQFAKTTTSAEKEQFRRPRPFVLDPSAPICVPRKPGATPSYAYPSGHATVGWATGLLLARLLPDRHDALLARARAFAESRVVCGVHWASDVWAGTLNGTSVFTSFEADPANAALFAKAEAELAALRKIATSPDGKRCAIEQDAEAHSPLAAP